MSDKTSNKIEKPWAVYRNLNFQYRLGKIVKDSENVYWIKFMEQEDSEPWDKRYVRAFDNPLKAIAYFIFFPDPNNHRSHKSEIHRENRYTTIQTFIAQFPSERPNIEKLLAPSQPKYTGLRIPSSGRIGEGSSLKSKSSIPNFGGLYQFFQSKRKKEMMNTPFDSLFS